LFFSSGLVVETRHCERSDLSAEAQRAKAEAIHASASCEMDCFAMLAMTVEGVLFNSNAAIPGWSEGPDPE
jgi:hypothetical protein